MSLRTNVLDFYADITSASPGVSGSCIHVSAHYPDKTSTNFVVDCGSFQELAYSNLNYSFNFVPSAVDFALITHAHIDHIGRLPFLVSKGFKGKIYCTKDTQALIPISLDDNFRISRNNAKHSSIPLMYDYEDVNKVQEQICGLEYNHPQQIDKHIAITLFKNGHIIGSATILVEISFPGRPSIYFVFSGDYNNRNPFFEVPPLPQSVYSLPVNIFIESTYAYMNSSEIVYNFERNVSVFFQNHPSGTLVIPCFSLRFLEVLLKLHNMQVFGLLDSNIPVYADGKLASKYMNLFMNKEFSSIDEVNYSLIPRRLKFVNRQIRQNRYISTYPQIILASSGTASYGPAQGYLQKMLNREDVMFHFTGYAPEGTLAKRLMDTQKDEFAQVGGVLVRKNAQIMFTNEFSAHAKRDELLNFLKPFKRIHAVFPTHGQESSKLTIGKDALAHTSAQNVGILSNKVCFRVTPDGLVSSNEVL